MSLQFELIYNIILKTRTFTWLKSYLCFFLNVWPNFWLENTFYFTKFIFYFFFFWMDCWSIHHLSRRLIKSLILICRSVLRLEFLFIIKIALSLHLFVNIYILSRLFYHFLSKKFIFLTKCNIVYIKIEVRILFKNLCCFLNWFFTH